MTVSVGFRVGRLEVVSTPYRVRGHLRVDCKCDCGTTKQFHESNVRSGKSRSCGCNRVIVGKAKLGIATKHGGAGGAKTVEYKAWCAIIDRCTNPRSKIYADYGGRGIALCAAWRHDFKAFLEHIGPRPTGRYSVDRIDNDRGYEPGNVRWATDETQNRNQRRRPKLIAFGQNLTPAEWAEKTGLPVNAINMRRRLGWSVERILTTPLRSTKAVSRAEAS